jgi:phage anti-repressor protein/phage antirepressor YoqD-like protein
MENIDNFGDISYEYITDPIKEGKWLPENQLIPLKYRPGKSIPFIDSRDLYKFLNLSSPHSDWMKYQIERVPLLENKDFASLSEFSDKPQGGRPATVWLLSVEAAKKICMMARGKRGEEARDYFIWCEQELINIRNGKFIPEHQSMPTEINGDFIIAIGEQMNKLQQSLKLATRVIEDNADILSGKDAAETSDMLFHIRDFVKFTGDSRVPNKLKEQAFREQLIKDGFIYTKINSNHKEYYPTSRASQWFIAKLSSTHVNTRYGKKKVTGVTLQMTLKGVCWALSRYAGVPYKTAQQIIAEATGNDNRNLTVGKTDSPKSVPSQTPATPVRSLTEPTQFIENGVVKPIEAKIERYA